MFELKIMKILVVEDEKGIRDSIKASLEAEYFSVDVAEDGEAGSILARSNDYDLIVLDYILPKKLGLEICREIRTRQKAVPIIILSVISEPHKKVNLLNSGADDYLTKPFSFEELLARIRALLRRPQEIKSEILKIDDLVLNTTQHVVTLNGKEVYLTRKEFELLEYLMRNQGKVLSRGLLMEHVWDMNADPFSNTIETHILNLRRKIDLDAENKLIHTLPGSGYRMMSKKLLATK
jgi:DNA-binding response OmpR family regulator